MTRAKLEYFNVQNLKVLSFALTLGVITPRTRSYSTRVASRFSMSARLPIDS